MMDCSFNNEWRIEKYGYIHRQKAITYFLALACTRSDRIAGFKILALSGILARLGPSQLGVVVVLDRENLSSIGVTPTASDVGSEKICDLKL